MNWKHALFALCSLVVCGLSVAASTSVAMAGDDADTSGSAADGGGDGGGPGRK
jgi:hypothetical protein